MSFYQQLNQVEEDALCKNHSRENATKWNFLKTYSNVKLFVLSHIITLGIYALGLYIWRAQQSDRSCDIKYSTYSPALPIINYEQPKHLDAEIVQTNKYRGSPSPEIDAEWLKVGLGTPAIRLFDDDLKQLNKSDTSDRPLHRIPEEFGGGYLAMLEVFHLLHCLNSLRKAMDKEYYAEERTKAGESAMRAHDEHCIDMLRVYIKCTSDVTPITFYDNILLPSRKLPMPDFSTLHTCRNFDDIWEWNGNNERTLQWDEIGLDLGDMMHVD